MQKKKETVKKTAQTAVNKEVTASKAVKAETKAPKVSEKAKEQTTLKAEKAPKAEKTAKTVKTSAKKTEPKHEKLTREEIKNKLIDELAASRNVSLEDATDRDMYFALGNLVRELVGKEWVKSKKYYKDHNVKQVYYFSLEFLMGKALRKNLSGLNLFDDMKKVLSDMGFDIFKVMHIEPDAGLGNGGLGRLAACFLDSLAACGYAGHGNGIRYRHGLFRQKIVDGYQVEEADNWLSMENIYETRKSQDAVEVPFYGEVITEYTDGKLKFIHQNYDGVFAIPYDTPILGYRNHIVNRLRLWSAEPKEDEEFNFSKFSRGEYSSAVEYRQSVRAISDVLYPDDSNYSNKLLRLKQQYFFVCAGIHSIIKSYLKNGNKIEDLYKHVAIHINDTHPALCVPELMRILVDEYELPWEQSWDITTKTLSYTNHTIMPEALEKWPISMYKSLLPRIFMITEEINKRLCSELYEIYPGDDGKVAYMAIIQNDVINMANMCVAGCHSVNGVAAVHSQILKDQLFHDYYMTTPNKFNNKTNGITHRRWLVDSNEGLTKLITKSIGNSFITDPLKLDDLYKKGFCDNEEFLKELDKIKYENKVRLAEFIKNKQGTVIDPNTIFDIQVKRIHAYKRQLLNAFRILWLYFEVKDNPKAIFQPVTFMFGGKAAPGYAYAKLTIKFINSVANLVNNDPDTKDKIKVVFLENYNVSFAQHIFPAADISEQISTASKEASGTSNMKFMMNGALTLGTMDGANIEIAEAVGDENIFTFGLSVSEVLERYRNCAYNNKNIYDSNYKIKRILDTLKGDFYKDANPGEFMPIFDSVVNRNDEYFVLEDFVPYVEETRKAYSIYKNNRMKWLKMSAFNIAKSGRFSSDETIRAYANEIWDLKVNKIK